jgi:cytochrome c peroxidase
MMGFFKSPGLRNVDKRVNNGARTYMHNGALVSLEQVVHFYNTRDVRSCSALGIPEAGSVLPTGPGDTRANACWPAPDFPQTVVRDLGGGIRGVLGDLRLTPQEEARIVAFMKTLTDR